MEKDKDSQSEEDSKSYFSDDDDSQEELLIFLINEANSLFKQKLRAGIEDIIDPVYLKSLILRIEPLFEINFASISITSLSSTINNEDSENEIKESNIRIIISSLQIYFSKVKLKNSYKIKSSLDIDKMIDISSLMNKERKDMQGLAVLLLVFISTSTNSELFLDCLAEQKEKFLDGFLTIIQKYIELTDESTADKIDPKQRRFTKRSSITSFNDPTALYCSIEKLRKRVEELEEENRQIKRNYEYLSNKMKQQSLISNEEISSRSKKEVLMNEQVNKVIKENNEIKEKYQKENRELREKCNELEKNVFEMKIENDKAKDLKEENELLKKEFDEYKQSAESSIEKLKTSNKVLSDTVSSLDKEKSTLENRIISLRNDLRIEQQKSNTSHITITALQNKFKEFLQNKTEIDEENEKNKVIEEETEQQKQINQLLKDMQERNSTIFLLNKEIKEINEKIESKKKLSVIKNNEFSYEGIVNNYKTEILLLKEEIRKRDRDISFLKNAYNDINMKSEEEYNTVSSSLYELAFHLTKIKDTMLPNPQKNTTNNTTNRKFYSGSNILIP